jgi:hypothetical protein
MMMAEPLKARAVSNGTSDWGMTLPHRAAIAPHLESND